MKRRFSGRFIIQIFFLILFLVALMITSYPVLKLNAGFLVGFDPLAWLTTFISSREMPPHWIPALVFALIGILLGRVFCGYICPMGTILDISDKFIKKRKYTKTNKISKKARYFLLSAIIITALLGIQTYGWFDPLSIFTRTVTTALYGPLQMLAKASSGWIDAMSYSDIKIISGIFTPVGDLIGKNTYLLSPVFYFKLSLLFLVLFSFIIFLNTYSKRFWCRYICPLGTFIGILSKYNIIKRKVSENCNSCGICRHACSMGAIDNNNFTSETDCIKCGECKIACPQKSVYFLGNRKNADIVEAEPERERLSLLMGGFAGILFASVIKMDPSNIIPNQNKSINMSSPYNLRPPNAVSENEFLGKCIRCGACVKACPGNALQFSLNQSGEAGLWTPNLVPSVGVCHTDCNACSLVCPTGAIKKFKIEEKHSIIIGRAVVDKNRCIAWGRDEHCAVCQEYCPYRAITLLDRNGIPSPTVNDLCVGCGACENACPVQPDAAIRVRVSDKAKVVRDKFENSKENDFDDSVYGGN